MWFLLCWAGSTQEQTEDALLAWGMQNKAGA